MMEIVCIEERKPDKHLHEGLRVLARIIARDVMASKAVNGDFNNGGKNNQHLQDKRPVSLGLS